MNIINKIVAFILRVVNKILRRNFYVIMDPDDNSITVSRDLYHHIDRNFKDAIDVFMFRVPASGHYAFTINPVQEGWLDEEELHGNAEGKGSPAVSDLSYNSLNRCIGFAAACPTVNLMLTEWDMPLVKVKVPVKVRKFEDNIYYVIWR